MGATASISADNPSTVVSALKAEYEQCSSMSDQETWRRLKHKYMQVQAEELARVGEMNATAALGQAVSDNQVGAGDNRRRSFGQDNPGEVPADSWDSVRDQPHCILCNMSFQSEAKLRQHTDYSDLHRKNLKKHEKKQRKLRREQGLSPTGSTASSPPSSPSAHLEDAAPAPAEPQIKLLYSGSKLFWRSNETIEVQMFTHVQADCIEIVSNDADSAREYNRLYLNGAQLRRLIGEDKVQQLAQTAFGARMARSQAKSEGASRKKEDEAVVTLNDIVEDTWRKEMSSFLLSRLSLSVAADSPEKKLVTLSSQTGDEGESPVCEKPNNMKAAVVHRRRKTTEADFERTMEDLRIDSLALSEASNKANRLSELASSSMNMLKNLMEQSQRRQAKQAAQSWSRAKKRWFWAAHKINLLKAVERATERLYQIPGMKESLDAEYALRGEEEKVVRSFLD